jgi:hypothetical protein
MGERRQLCMCHTCDQRSAGYHYEMVLSRQPLSQRKASTQYDTSYQHESSSAPSVRQSSEGRGRRAMQPHGHQIRALSKLTRRAESRLRFTYALKSSCKCWQVCLTNPQPAQFTTCGQENCVQDANNERLRHNTRSKCWTTAQCWENHRAHDATNVVQALRAVRNDQDVDCEYDD